MKNKFMRVMNRRNNQFLYQSEKKLIKKYRKTFKKNNLFYKVENDYDYIKFEITLVSYLNMKALQENYFNTKESLRDLWNNINYQEKKFLLYKELDKLNQNLKYFTIEGDRYYIAYFGELLNAYYDHEILIFETSNYRDLLFNYQDLVIDVESYGLLPIENGFSEVRLLAKDANDYVLYSDRIKRFYHSSGFNFAMHRRLSEANIKKIASLMLADDLSALLDYLIDYDLVNERVKRVFKRMRD